MIRRKSGIVVEVTYGAATYRRVYKTSEAYKIPLKDRKIDVDVTMGGYAFPIVTIHTSTKDTTQPLRILTLRSDNFGKLQLTALFLNVLLRDPNLRTFIESCASTHGTVKISKRG